MQETTSVQVLFEQGIISRRLHAALLRNGFTDLRELSGYNHRHLPMLPALGPSTLSELTRLLSEKGINLS